MKIPPELLPHRAQVPSFVLTDADRERFNLCFALGRLITGRDDPVFVREVYASDINTGDLASLPEPDPDEQLDDHGSPIPDGPRRA